MAKGTISLESVTLEPWRSLAYWYENEAQSSAFQISYININTNFFYKLGQNIGSFANQAPKQFPLT